MKLIQIKEFNTQTLTPEIAYQIFAIAGLWGSYNSPERIKTGMEVEERWFGKRNEGGGGNHQKAWNNPNFTLDGHTRTYVGLSLKPLCGTSHKFYLDKSGKISCFNIHQKGDFRSGYTGDKTRGIPAHTEYYDKFTINPEYSCDQIKLLQLYLDLGFYTIEQ